MSVLQHHPQREWIVDQLVRGTPYRTIIAKCKPGVSIVTICKLKKQLTQDIQAAELIAKVKEMEELAVSEHVNQGEVNASVLRLTRQSQRGAFALKRIAKRFVDIDSAIRNENGELVADGKDLAQLVGAEVRLLELQCKLDGSLQPDNGVRGVQINLILPNREQTPVKDAITIDVTAAPSSSDA